MNTRILILLFFVFLFALTLFPAGDLDMGWHLQTGKYIVKNFSFPVAGEFSYTANGEWIMDEWLAQVLLYLLYSFAGINGLIIFRVIVVSVIAVFMCVLAKDHINRNGLILLPALCALYLSYERFLIKPSILTMLFLSLCLMLFMQYERTGGRQFFILPFLQALWVNIHPGFIMGIFIAFMFFINTLFSRGNIRARIDTAAVLTGVIIASTINPYGPKFLFWSFMHLSRAHIPIFMNNIAEWQKPAFFSDGITLKGAVFLLLLCFSTAGFLRRGKNQSPANVMLFLSLLYMSFVSRRHIGLFAIAAFFIIISNKDYLCIRLSEAGNRIPVKGGPGKKGNFFTAGVLFLSTAGLLSGYGPLYANSFRGVGLGISDALSQDAVSFCRTSSVPGRIFNEHALGGSCIKNLYPAKKVFIDGRNLLYLDGTFREYMTVLNDPSRIDALADKYGIKTLIFRHASGVMDKFTEYVFRSERWKCVYIDAWACVFTDTAVGYKGLDAAGIKKISGLDALKSDMISGEKNFAVRNHIRRKLYFSYLNWAHLFELLSDDDEKMFFYGKAAEVNPYGRAALEHMAYHYLIAGNYDKSIEKYGQYRKTAFFSIRGLNNLAGVFILKGENKKAMYYLDFAALLNPFEAEICFNRAIVFMREGYTDKAMSLCRFAVFLKRDYYQAFAMLGDIYRVKGDAQKALYCYAQAIAIKPDYSYCYNSVGSLYMDVLGEYRLAESFFRKAVQIDKTGTAAAQAAENLKRLEVISGK